MPTTTRRYTVDEVLAFPADGNRYEVVHGELLVNPAPRLRHQRAVTLLSHHLEAYLEGYPGLAVTFVAPADITWGTQDDLAQPDAFVVPHAEVGSEWSGITTLLLAVEVISPSSVKADRVTKRRLYQERGVATYWVVDPDAELVEVWHPGDERPEIVTDLLRWRVAPDAEELVIDLRAMFTTLPGR
jgi:Uma2 family endonuclease